MSAADEAKRTAWSEARRSWFPPRTDARSSCARPRSPRSSKGRSLARSATASGCISTPLDRYAHTRVRAVGVCNLTACPSAPPSHHETSQAACAFVHEAGPLLTASLLLLFFAGSTTRLYDAPHLAHSSTTQGVLHARRFPLLGTPSRSSASAPAQSRFRSSTERAVGRQHNTLPSLPPTNFPPPFYTHLPLHTPKQHAHAHVHAQTQTTHQRPHKPNRDPHVCRGRRGTTAARTRAAQACARTAS
ncbi:hypothetical protein K438DRAFT_1960962 [Mycena galopus ATCC 62051]|nr:hypothetical protein K438DRAFT_1960962 [Mycena galopus ATCC 62051]